MFTQISKTELNFWKQKYLNIYAKRKTNALIEIYTRSLSSADDYVKNLYLFMFLFEYYICL